MNPYLIWGGPALVLLLMMAGARQAQGLISLVVTGACVWFAYWVLSTHCGGGC